MARTQRPFSSMIAEIYRRLREDEATSYWGRALLIDLFNEQKDLREMELQGLSEGFGIRIFSDDLIANHRFYTIPKEAGRLKRVMLVYPDSDTVVPLTRDERLSTISTESSATVTLYGSSPTFRLVGNYIEISPPPAESKTDGLRIEMEEATPRLTADPDLLPTDWPLFAENLLVLDTVVAALEHEDDQGIPADGQVRGVYRSRARYEERWLDYCAVRTRGRVFATPFPQGA